MSQKRRIAIIAGVVFIAGVIFFLPQLQNLFGFGPQGQIEENILVALEQAEKEKKPIFLDFYGGFWPSCLKMEPVVQALAKEYGDRITFIKADVQSSEGQGLAQQFKIQYIPSFFLIKDKKILFQHTGEIKQADLEKELKKVY